MRLHGGRVKVEASYKAISSKRAKIMLYLSTLKKSLFEKLLRELGIDNEKWMALLS